MRKLLTLMLLSAAMLPALGQAQSTGVEVPLMLAPDAARQGFVRIINESNHQAGTVRITAVDDGGTAASPIEIRLAAGQSLHFNSDDLANGNAAKGINRIGLPRQGHWRLAVETALDDVQVLAFVRTRAGFLTAMHDTLPRDDQGRLVVRMLNPGSNRNQESSLRLVNTGGSAERVSIEGVDDQGNAGGPVTLTLAAGQSRTFTAFDLERGAQGLTGTLGDRAGRWRLRVTAGQSVVGMSLLETAIGPITNLSTAGVPAAKTAGAPGGRGSSFDVGPGNSFDDAINLAVGGRISARIDPPGDSDYYSIRVSESGTLSVYTWGNLDTVGDLYDSGESQLASNDDGASDRHNFRIQREVDAGTYYVRVSAYFSRETGNYDIHAEFHASTEPEPPTTQQAWGAIAMTPTNRSDDVPLVGGISWGYGTRQDARARAIQECGHSECRYATDFDNTGMGWHRYRCGAAAHGSLIRGDGSRKVKGFGAAATTLADAQAEALFVCRAPDSDGTLRNCELWAGMAACADGSHANSNPGAPGGMMIRVQP